MPREVSANGERETSTPKNADAAVEGETERFDGLINEPGNPPRQPALDRREQRES